jgi:hypothetical protein
LNDQILVGEQDRVPVGRRVCHRGGADRAGGAGQILHVERIATSLRQLLCDDACECVTGIAGRIGQDKFHRMGRVAFG